MLTATTTIQASRTSVRAWFLSLNEHPERYRFDTHSGFQIVAGDFGEIGSRFFTREVFAGFPLTLHFTLDEVGEFYFHFRVRNLPLKIWGQFTIVESSSDVTRLSLDVGSDMALGETFLRSSFLGRAVQHQIQSEVDHIKCSIEALEGERGRDTIFEVGNEGSVEQDSICGGHGGISKEDL